MSKDHIHYDSCPVCGSSAIRDCLSVRDHTVSREVFSISECSDCSLRFTQDVPGESAIGPYYRSDDYISHTNTARGLVNRTYQLVRKRTLKQKRKLVVRETEKSTGRLLDLGSGTGAFAAEMQRAGWEVLGLEPDPSARELAKEINKIDLRDLSAFYALPDSSFDAITLWHVLEHVHQLNPYMEKLRSLLKPGGILLIAVPNYTSKDAEQYREFWAAYDVPRHLYHFSPAAMQRLVENKGMVIRKYLPMWYDSFYISLLSSKYRSGRTRYFSAFWRGLVSNMQALRDARRCSSVIYVISC